MICAGEELSKLVQVLLLYPCVTPKTCLWFSSFILRLTNNGECGWGGVGGGGGGGGPGMRITVTYLCLPVCLQVAELKC